MERKKIVRERYEHRHKSVCVFWTNSKLRFDRFDVLPTTSYPSSAAFLVRNASPSLEVPADTATKRVRKAITDRKEIIVTVRFALINRQVGFCERLGMSGGTSNRPLDEKHREKKSIVTFFSFRG